MNDSREQKASALLETIKQAQGGQLKIFLGSSPGVGKTYAMLNAAREKLQAGVPVLIGLVETHGRADTEALLSDFQILPRKQIEYHNHVLTEFDLDEAIRRRPKLILVDELAHTNAPGSRHNRRYQDITELLAAGINVYTTLNIQHLESLNDIVLQITGVRVRETVPDRFIDDAQEIVFIDLSPATLIERLQEGKIYLPEYANQALDSFFSHANLIALRELAMREVMERVDKRLKTEQLSREQETDYLIYDKLLVLISNRSDHRFLIRIGRQIADRRRIPWKVVWVDTGRPALREDKAQLQWALSLATQLGAETEVLRGQDTFQVIVPFIINHRINIVLTGAGTRRFGNPWRKRLYQKLIASGLPLEVTVCHPPDHGSTVRTHDASSQNFLGNIKGHLLSLVAIGVATALAVFLETWLNSGNLVLIYVIAVIYSGLKHGAGPAFSTAVLSFLSFNFFLTDPKYSLHIAQQDDIATLMFLAVIALLCGPAASHLRNQFILLNESGRYSDALRSLGEKLSVADSHATLWLAVAREASSILKEEACIVATESENEQTVYPEPSTPLAHIDKGAIEWTRKHASPSGRFTDTLNASTWSLFPVIDDGKTIAILIVRFGQQVENLKPYDKDLITAMLQQVADTSRRIRLTGDLESSRMKAEVEQLRSALLSSVSHDLKSPLAAMTGAAELLKTRLSRIDATERDELIDTIMQEGSRLESYIQNLLDMTRLGHGTLKIERDWVSIDDILGSAVSRLKRYFPGIQTEYQSISPAPQIYAHAALIEQALFNILENAARFSPAGEKIGIQVKADRNTCYINIEDRGPGIPEASREKIFDMFYATSDGDQKSKNTGMGLAICRGMIGAHGGKVSAHAGNDGKGTLFLVELPIDQTRT